MKCPPTLSDASLDHKVHNRNTNGRREMAVSEVAPFTLALVFEHGRSEIIDHREIQVYADLHVVFNSFDRYEKRHSNIPAHISPCFRVKEGDHVTVE
nr:40S ribosomal protein S11 [Tanacetum cinerariifolium]